MTRSPTDDSPDNDRGEEEYASSKLGRHMLARVGTPPPTGVVEISEALELAALHALKRSEQSEYLVLHCERLLESAKFAERELEQRTRVSHAKLMVAILGVIAGVAGASTGPLLASLNGIGEVVATGASTLVALVSSVLVIIFRWIDDSQKRSLLDHKENIDAARKVLERTLADWAESNGRSSRKSRGLSGERGEDA